MRRNRVLIPGIYRSDTVRHSSGRVSSLCECCWPEVRSRQFVEKRSDCVCLDRTGHFWKSNSTLFWWVCTSSFFFLFSRILQTAFPVLSFFYCLNGCFYLVGIENGFCGFLHEHLALVYIIFIAVLAVAPVALYGVILHMTLAAIPDNVPPSEETKILRQSTAIVRGVLTGAFVLLLPIQVR